MVITKWAPEGFWSGNIHHTHCPTTSHLRKAQRRCSSVGYKVKLWCVAFLGMNVIHIGLLLRLNCQWHTEPKRWFNSALVSNPFPVTHNFLLTPQQLGQPAGEKTHRCCWLELEVVWGPSSVQSAQNALVGRRVWVFPPLQTRHGWGCLLCHGPSLILLSLSKEHYSSSP